MGHKEFHRGQRIYVRGKGPATITGLGKFVGSIKIKFDKGGDLDFSIEELNKIVISDKLIAASPELLEASELVLEALERSGNGRNFGAKFLRAAIKKAKK